MTQTEHHLMIDIETLSTRTDAHVISLAMAYFDPYAAESDASPVQLIVPSYEGHDQRGHGYIDPETVRWHLERGHQIPDPTCKADVLFYRLIDTLDRDEHYRGNFDRTDDSADDGPVTHIWAKGPDFDLRILENLYQRCGQRWPAHYRSYRCVRTLCETVGIDVSTTPTHKHDVVEDVRVQIRAVQDAHRILGLRGPAARVGTAFREKLDPLPLFQTECPVWATKPFGGGWIFRKGEPGPELISIQNGEIYFHNLDADDLALDSSCIALWSCHPLVVPDSRGS